MCDDPDEQAMLGYMFENGINGKKKDMQKAVECYTLAADEGHEVALASLGRCYLEGLGVEVDHARAFELLKDAVDLGNAIAMFYLGECYRFGYGVRMDLNKALRLYGESDAIGCKKATQILRDISIEHQDLDHPNLPKPKDSFKNKPAPKRGRPTARTGVPRKPKSSSQAVNKKQLENAIACFYDPNSPPIGKEVIATLQTFAKQRDHEAQYWLGRAYFHSLGVRQDFVNAVRWFRKSSLGKHAKQADSCLYLAMCYLFALGSQVIIEEVLKTSHLAQTLGSFHGKIVFQAMTNLPKDDEGMYLLDDINETRNRVIASLHAKSPILADLQSPIDIMFRVSLLGVTRANSTPTQQLKSNISSSKSALPSPSMSLLNLPSVGASPFSSQLPTNPQPSLLFGTHTPSNNSFLTPPPTKTLLVAPTPKISNANELMVQEYQEQAKRNDRFAQAKLGICYLFGIVVPKDEVTATRWFAKSAKSHFLGKYCMACCLAAGIGCDQDLGLALAQAQEAARFLYPAKDLVQELQSLPKDTSTSIPIIPQSAAHLHFISGAACWELSRFMDMRETQIVDQSNPLYDSQASFAKEKAVTSVEENLPGESIVEKMKDLAKKGNATAQFHLGICYLNGLVVRLDPVNAVRWFSKSAKHLSLGGYCLACCSAAGVGVDRDLELAVKLASSVSKDVPEANDLLKELGSLSKDNDGLYILPSNLSQYKYLSGTACKQLRKYLSSSPKTVPIQSQPQKPSLRPPPGVLKPPTSNANSEVLVQKLQAQAKGGRPLAQLHLGLCYLSGFVVRLDEVNAARWFSKAAKKLPMGQYCLACCLASGTGMDRDIDKAIQLCKDVVKYVWQAADLLAELQTLKKDGDGCFILPQVLERYTYLSGKACANLYKLVDFIRPTTTSSTSVPTVSQNLSSHPSELMVKRIQSQAKIGDPIAQAKLGICYLEGKVVRQDPVNATRWFSKSAKKVSLGKYCLACCFAAGLGIDRNIGQALTFATEASKDLTSSRKLVSELRKVVQDSDGCYVVPEDLSRFPFLSGRACAELIQFL